MNAAGRPTRTTGTPGRQQGAALVVALVLLMALTVLAVSTMRTATLELLMAGNAQFRENAFRIAETGLAREIRGFALDPTPLETAPPCPAPADPPLAPGAPVAVADLAGRYRSTLCVEGASTFVIGSSLGKVAEFQYRLTAEAETDQRGARTRLVQGIHQLAPAAP